MFTHVREALGPEIADAAVRPVPCQPWFDRLEASFPVGYNRIAWERIANKHRIDVLESPRAISSDELAPLLAALRPTVVSWFTEAKTHPAGLCVWIGDTSDMGLEMSCATALQHYPVLMSLPQHTYVLDGEMRWCLNYVMEGELFFGYGAHDSASVRTPR